MSRDNTENTETAFGSDYSSTRIGFVNGKLGITELKEKLITMAMSAQEKDDEDNCSMTCECDFDDLGDV